MFRDMIEWAKWDKLAIKERSNGLLHAPPTLQLKLPTPAVESNEELESEIFGREVDNCDMAEDYQTNHNLHLPSTSQIRITLTNTALTNDRYKISERATAAIVSSVLLEFGTITERHSTLVIDNIKVRPANI